MRLARIITVPAQQQLSHSSSLQVASLGTSIAPNTASLPATSAVISIKQESLSSVDNLVGGFVDSTTFLHSPNRQMVNPNLIQNNALTNENLSVDGEKFIINLFPLNFFISL